MRPRPDPFVAIADPTRRAILDRLRETGGAPVSEIAAGFDISRPAVSKHLRILRDARLIAERASAGDGRQRIYEVRGDPLREVAAWTERYEAFWARNLVSLKRHLEQPRPRTGRDRKP